MINIAVIGFGYWGPNLARNFNSNPKLTLKTICDFASDRRQLAQQLYPGVKVVADLDLVFNDSSIDAIAIATPVSTHFDLAYRALASGRHVWIEKPLTETSEQARELIGLAEKKNRIIMVDHTFIYTGSVTKIKEIIDSGKIGDIIYYDSTRVNLGLFQNDVDVIWDLAPHDISIMDYLMPFKKMAISATGASFHDGGQISKAVLTIFMENNTIGHINVSWISPVKIRQTLIGGTSKMILYDDNQPSEKIRIYDKGVDIVERKEDLYKINVQYRVGDMWAPKIDNVEALAVATEQFASCIMTNSKPITDGTAGLEVVKILEASKKSLKKNGEPITL